MAIEKTSAPKAEKKTSALKADVETPAIETLVAPEQSRNSANEEADFNQTVKNMKEFLDAQPKVQIFIPLENGEVIRPGAVPVLPVGMNGYVLNVPKGSYQSVPKPIADIILESLNIQQNNSATGMQLDASDPDKAAALNI